MNRRTENTRAGRGLMGLIERAHEQFSARGLHRGAYRLRWCLRESARVEAVSKRGMVLGAIELESLKESG